MNFFTLKRAFVALALIAPIASASATVVTIDRTIDLNTVYMSGIWLIDGNTGPSFWLAEGDTLKFNIDFAGNQTLKVVNPLNFFGAAMATDTDCVNYTATGTLSFMDAKGPLKSGTHVDRMACSHVGNQFATATVTTGPGMVEFSGLSFTIDVNDYDLVHTRQYQTTLLQIAAESYEIGQSNNVPEPASLGLMGLGIAGLIAGRRRSPKR